MWKYNNKAIGRTIQLSRGKQNREKEEGKTEKEKEEEKEEERKANITITPWSNEERNAKFSELKVENDDVFVSTIFNIRIQEIKPVHDEDSTTTSDTTRSEDKVKAAGSVEFKYDSPLLEKVVSIHSIVDSTDDEKTVDFITLSLEVEIAKNLVIYTCHQYNGNTWTRTEIEQKVGRTEVEVDVYDFKTETVFFTLRYMTEEIVVPSCGFKYLSDFCPHQGITFPEGAVDGETKVTISTMSIEGECKKKRLEKEMGCDTSISSLSDFLHVQHSQKFKKKVKVRLKLDPLFNDNTSFKTFLLHCDDNDCLEVFEDVDIRKVPEEEVGGDNHIYEVEVDSFSTYGCVRGDTRQDPTRIVTKTSGLGRDQCRILVFLCKEDNDLHLWSDIVREEKWKERESELKKREGMIFIKNTVSPSVPVKNFGRLRITLLTHGRMLPASDVPSNSKFMYYDRNAREIYNHFPVVPNKGINSTHGIIQYEMDTSPKRLLHTAYINADLYFTENRQTRDKAPAYRESQPTKNQWQPKRPSTSNPRNRRKSRESDTNRAQSASRSRDIQPPQRSKTDLVPARPTSTNTDEIIYLRELPHSQRPESQEQLKEPISAQAQEESPAFGANNAPVYREQQPTKNQQQPKRPTTSIPKETNRDLRELPHSQNPESQEQLKEPISAQTGAQEESPAFGENNDFFSERSLLVLAREIPTSKIWEVMIHLGIRQNKVDNIRAERKDDTDYKMTLLSYWHNSNKNNQRDQLDSLCNALKESEMTPIADVLERVYNNHRSLKASDFSLHEI